MADTAERGPVVWPLDHGIPWPWLATQHVSLLALANLPTQAKDLVGWKARIVRGGEAVGSDFDPHRISILVDGEGRVVDLVVG